ncbi:hypothetical protein [Paracerasibacillus soli]|uniref:Uncharacterized protein n=1 Tax=Paracerasibacillus soli TaxID=480284 RepID=A0ABU5CQY6_9BACI|nr:hypothetical protein [Virgibacillus soli]MDY0408209.1 hypothetical protein [Virgibacillus soli]
MKQMKESILKQKGYRLHVVQTNKFKTIHVVAKLKAPLSRDTITYRSLLPYVLQQGPKSYPTRKALSDQLDYLYGAVLSIDGAKKGENHIISFRLELANEKFIRDESGIFKNAMALFHDMIFNPNIEDGAFIDAIVKREKDTLRQRMSAMLDDKMSYANLRLVDEMCKDELYHLHVHGYEDDLDTISGKICTIIIKPL